MPARADNFEAKCRRSVAALPAYDRTFPTCTDHPAFPRCAHLGCIIRYQPETAFPEVSTCMDCSRTGIFPRPASTASIRTPVDATAMLVTAQALPHRRPPTLTPPAPMTALGACSRPRLTQCSLNLKGCSGGPSASRGRASLAGPWPVRSSGFACSGLPRLLWKLRALASLAAVHRDPGCKPACAKIVAHADASRSRMRDLHDAAR